LVASVVESVLPWYWYIYLNMVIITDTLVAFVVIHHYLDLIIHNVYSHLSLPLAKYSQYIVIVFQL